MAQDINHYLAATSPENVSNGLSGPQETHYVNTGMSDVYGLLVLASIGASAYHGFKRNDSVGWGIVWGLLGGIAPVITPAIAVAQGFGEPERQGNPTKEEEPWWAAHDGNQVFGIGQTEKLALDDAFHGKNSYVRIRGAPSGLKVDRITEDQMVMAYYDSHWPIKVPSASDNAERIALRRQRGELVENYYEYGERTRRERERIERERRGR
jgi:hypothetical protein